MGLIKSLLTLPVAGPIKSTTWIAGKIHEAAETEYNDPGMIRRSLTSLEQQLLAGDISEEEYDDAETALLLRLKAAS